MTMPPLPEPDVDLCDGYGWEYSEEAMIAYGAACAAAYKSDAERYRWLRAQHWHSSDLAVVYSPRTVVRIGAYLPSGDLLDEAIDASRAALKETP